MMLQLKLKIIKYKEIQIWTSPNYIYIIFYLTGFELVTDQERDLEAVMDTSMKMSSQCMTVGEQRQILHHGLWY